MQLMCFQPNYFADSTRSESDLVWVETTLLRRFFSCKDGLDDIFHESAVKKDARGANGRLLFSHPTGLHPKEARKGKLITRELYAELDKIISEELSKFPRLESNLNSSSTETDGIDLKNHAVEHSALTCAQSGIQHQSEGRKKLEIFQMLISIYEDLTAGQNDLDITSDLSESDVFVIYRPWVTSLRKCVESILAAMKGAKKAKLDFVDCGGADALILDGVITDVESEVAVDQKKTDSTGNDVLDRRVNTKITCEHGNCHAMHKRRSVRLIPRSIWSKILQVFPDAIPHKFEPKMEEALGNCSACFQEKQREEQFPLQLTEWKNQVKQPGTLTDLYTKGGNDGETDICTPPEIDMFLELCAHSEDKTDKLTCYIVHCREIQKWRDAYDCIVKAKKAKKTNDFIRMQLNTLLFKPFSDDACIREWNFRSLTCATHKRTVGFPFPDIDAINGDVNKLKEWLSLMSASKFQLLLEDEFRSFITSLSALEEILHGNNSARLDETTPTIVISNDDGVPGVEVQPSPCSEGCSISLFDDEYLDNGVICKRAEESVSAPAAAEVEVVPIEEEPSGPTCKIVVHKVENDLSIDVAASTIGANLSSNEVEEVSNQRRGLRRRKRNGEFPTYEVEMALDGNLAHFRLLLYQVSRERVRNQRLYIMSQFSVESPVTELTHLRDEETMQVLISKSACNNENDTAPKEEQMIHIIMSYDDSGSTKLNSRGTEKRMTKEERDEEDALIATLTDKSCGGWKTADVVVKGKKSGNRQERGFQGTFLQSSLSQNSEPEQNTPVKKSDDIPTVHDALLTDNTSSEDPSKGIKVSEKIADEDDVDPSLANSPEQPINENCSDEVMIVDFTEEEQNMNVDTIDETESSSKSEMETIFVTQDRSKWIQCEAQCAIHDSTCNIMKALDIGPGWTVHIIPRKGKRNYEDKIYFAPNGQKFRSFREVQRHLQQYESVINPGKRKREASQAELVDQDKSNTSDLKEFETVAGRMSTSELKVMQNIIEKELASRKGDDDQAEHKSKYFT